MRQLNFQELVLISGGNNEELQFSVLGLAGAALGLYITCYQGPNYPFLYATTVTITPGETVWTYTPQMPIVFSAVILGYSLGYSIEKALRKLG